GWTDNIAQRGKEFDPAIGATRGALPLAQRGEEVGDGVADFHDEALALGVVGGDEQALLGAVVVKLVQQVVELAGGDTQAELTGGDIFKGVGFVDDEDVVVGEQAGVFPAEGDISHEQGMVDDDQVGVGDASPGGVVEAVGVGRAAAAETVAMFTLDFVPDRWEGTEVEIGAAAIAGFLGPIDDLLELGAFLLGVEEAVESAGGAFESTETDIVAASLG